MPLAPHSDQILLLSEFALPTRTAVLRAARDSAAAMEAGAGEAAVLWGEVA